MIKVIRNTGMMGAAGKIKIHINGEKVADVKQNKRIMVDIPDEQATLKVTQFGVRSDELLVHEGATVEVTTKPWNHIAIVILFIMMSLLSTILPRPYNIIGPILVSIFYIASYYFIAGYELKII